MKKTLIVSLAALALAGGCKKKDKDATPAPTTGTGSGTAVTPPGPGTAAPTPPPVAALTGDALAQHYLALWTALNAGDRAKYESFIAPTAVGHRPDMPEVKGPQALAEDGFMFRSGFPDGKASAQLVLVHDRTVAAVVLITGTNTTAIKSPMGDMPPTSKKVGFLAFHAVTYDPANQIVDEWWIADGNTFMAQLGMSPQPGRPVMDKGADAPTIVVATGSDTEKANLAATAKSNDDFNKRDVAALMAGLADDAVESDMGAPTDHTTKAAIEAGTKMFIGGFSDAKIGPLATFAVGDYTLVVADFTGTNDADMGPIKKTGKPVKMTVAEIYQYQAGKVKHLWRFYDSVSMIKQLGLLPDPAGAPPAGAPPAGTEPAGTAPKKTM